MGTNYFTGLNETKYDQNVAFSSARLFLKIIVRNIARSKFSSRKPYNFLQQWQELSHTR